MTPLKSIRQKCLECCCWQANEVKLCTAENCALYPYRLGHNPNRQGKGGGNGEALKRYRKNLMENGKEDE